MRSVKNETKEAYQSFNFNEWTDISADVKTIAFINSLSLIRMDFTITYDQTPAALNRFKAESNEFWEANRSDEFQTESVDK